MANEDSIIKKVKKHKKKAGLGVSIATLVLALQLYGQLAPLVCELPFIHDTNKCLEVGKRAQDAAHNLDAMSLDAGVLQ